MHTKITEELIAIDLGKMQEIRAKKIKNKYNPSLESSIRLERCIRKLL